MQLKDWKGNKGSMAEIVNLHLMPQSQIVPTEHQRPPHPQPPSQKKNLRKKSTQRITLLQSHTFTLTGSRHSSLTDPPSHAENEKHCMVKAKEQGRRERRSGSSGEENKARSVSRSILRCNLTRRQANQVMGRWRERVRVFAL